LVFFVYRHLRQTVLNIVYMKRIQFILVAMLLLFWIGCEEEKAESPSEDCAGVAGGNNICGCTDTTAFNYNSNATFDDGSCQSHIDNGDFYLFFNGSNAHVDLGGGLYQSCLGQKNFWVRRC